jgi:mRNA interferase MazF
LVISQGDVWWADLGDPAGSEPGFRRPVVVVQADTFNRSALRTVVVVPLTSNLRWASAPGNMRLTARATGLPRDSVANVSQIVTLDRSGLVERVGRLSPARFELVLAGIDTVLGRE